MAFQKITQTIRLRIFFFKEKIPFKGPPFKEKKLLVEPISVARVQPRTSKGHHRPVIASNFHSLNTNSLSKKY
jgi:hypothetical protein